MVTRVVDEKLKSLSKEELDKRWRKYETVYKAMQSKLEDLKNRTKTIEKKQNDVEDAQHDIDCVGKVLAGQGGWCARCGAFVDDGHYNYSVSEGKSCYSCWSDDATRKQVRTVTEMLLGAFFTDCDCDGEETQRLYFIRNGIRYVVGSHGGAGIYVAKDGKEEKEQG